jgi:hypothetical protein
MFVSLTVDAEVLRTEGKFASRDELEAQLIEALEEADPGSLEGDEGGQYEVSDWAVTALSMGKNGKPVNEAAATRKSKKEEPGTEAIPWTGLIKHYISEVEGTPFAEDFAEAFPELNKDLIALCERFWHVRDYWRANPNPALEPRLTPAEKRNETP